MQALLSLLLCLVLPLLTIACQMASLEDDFVMVDLNGSSHSLSSPHESRDDYLSAISHHVGDISDQLRQISVDIHDHPELKFHETHAHSVLTRYMDSIDGWKITRSAYGIETAFVAVFDSGKKGPTVSFNAEYDALEGIGHACGHNLIAIASLAGALATSKILKDEKLGGKVVLFGTPAEEGGGGKIKLLNAGAYKGVDVSLMSHPGISPDAALVHTAAYAAMKVEYFGREAHAAARPWDGINALDALITAYNSLSVLRQQTEPGDIIQMQITNGGLRPNIIHAYSSGQFVIRSASHARLEALIERVEACFEAGALATGAQLKVTRGGAYKDHVPNRALGHAYRSFFNRLGGDIPEADIDELQSVTQASTDQGDISHALPSLHSGFWIRSEDKDGKQLGGPHTPDFEKAARTQENHEIAMTVGKALAATAVEVLVDPKLLEEVKREFARSPLL